MAKHTCRMLFEENKKSNRLKVQGEASSTKDIEESRKTNKQKKRRTKMHEGYPLGTTPPILYDFLVTSLSSLSPRSCPYINLSMIKGRRRGKSTHLLRFIAVWKRWSSCLDSKCFL
mmetsp:Transcript_31930/g.63254  ORF Transcript_31930/g.63254 Transcript_31930/m.63254 type:complete len:116 (-) Transcript_31930:63-410(-)